MRTFLIMAASLTLAGGAASAQQAGEDHAKHGAAGAAGQHGQMAKQDYHAGMQRMHQAMMKAEDRDPDRAFALKMIEHHRGGIAMVDTLMKHGDDAELKRMAEKTKSDQQREIGELQAWLDRHGGRTPKP